ncbi:uncharacterized protein TrAtP1_004022 [Trichoderma atroviride]|uniref:DUF6546 domain-containing protein n=1 Tax=Hypocrea atroviridis (strain ATCC 20476 / IMI 206040) TaxID=452589 RepID=G9P6W6_HYPAI|nr:uncharacterized protein TRIATDRAFT_85454 [Trichoderma atroviride IMI 206040]EHK40691.1 hypothetical protein TRIATDRAFT_85454 [Trichoderma atroviride IMI 206040]UKZ62790.1 hypothetical protein TrAtP1_004022 [Trichoderma atroviride]
MSWHVFPLEIKHQILQKLIEDGGKLADFATVSREWQEKIEQHTFARIRLTPSRLAKFDSMTSRNRSLVRYLWLCLELDKYCCIDCALPTWVFNTNDDEGEVIMTALQKLFSVLSTWGSESNLSLDISVYSPSDSEHWFPHLTFEPDIPWNTGGHDRVVEQAGRARAADDQHDLNNVNVEDHTPRAAIDRVFGEIMNQDDAFLLPFTNDEQEDEWWQQLPLAPAVTSVLLRQQNRRRWKPRALAQMLSRLPMLRQLYYEPWREWGNGKQESRDESHLKFLESLALTDLKNLTIFENFNEKYAETFSIMDSRFKSIRTPSTALSRILSKVSLNFESLSGSFMVDACEFFNAHGQSSQEWPNLTLLVLTSQLLTPQQSHTDIIDMLQRAGCAATRMPKLETMEIWNGRKKLAAHFKYELMKEDRSAIITWKGTWGLTLQPSVVEIWEAVTTRRGGFRLDIVYETLDSDTIRSHGDAIIGLEVSERVVRPISLQQIRIDCDAPWTRTLPHL